MGHQRNTNKDGRRQHAGHMRKALEEAEQMRYS